MGVKTQAEKYADALGEEARARQEALAKERFVCCGTPKATGHHEMCHLRPEEPTAVDAHQESLL